MHLSGSQALGPVQPEFVACKLGKFSTFGRGQVGRGQVGKGQVVKYGFRLEVLADISIAMTMVACLVVHIVAVRGAGAHVPKVSVLVLVIR